LFSERVGQDCVLLVGSACDGLLAWTGFTPPITPFTGDPDVAEYDAAMGGSTNAATTGAYVAAKVLVAALRQAGPNLTRATLRRALDDLTFTSGLASRLDWGPRLPVDRVANLSARAVRMTVSGGTFRGWTDAGTGWVRDPWPGSFPD
jgi:ABC-type branched-subunit amino acid transport system substrate-binding protein